MTVSTGTFCVVTPNLNMGRYLVETIESVLQNLGPDDHYYVIDGGSTDDSIDILKAYANRLTGWISEKDNGYADAVNKGFKIADTDFQCWIGSGDLLLKGSLDNARFNLAKSNFDFIFGDDLYIDESSKVISYSSGKCSNLSEAMLYGDWTPLQDACFWRSDLYKKVGGLDISMLNAADYDLFAKFSVVGRAQYTPILFSAFRCHENQRSKKFMQRYREEKKISKYKILATLKKNHFERIILRIKNYLYIRFRGRVLQRLWNITALKNRNVSTISSDLYSVINEASK